MQVGARAALAAICGIASLAACSSGNGAAGPLGPQPQSKMDDRPHTETWRTPHPTPFGTAGLSNIPPRPTFVARLAHPTHAYPTPVPSPGAIWESPAMADTALAAYRPSLPADGIAATRYQVTKPSSTSCALVVRDVQTNDVEAAYAEARRALLAAGFVTELEVGRQHDGPFLEVLRAYTSGVKAMISTGMNLTSAVGPASRRYLVRVEFTQRCG